MVMAETNSLGFFLICDLSNLYSFGSPSVCFSYFEFLISQLGNLNQSVFVDNKHNFRKYSHSSIDSLGSPYDYGSIMHYGSRDFAKWPWQKTIKVKKSGASIGQRSHLSALDAEQLRKYYEC